ncbi:MAG: TonB-dependent receptor [Steroidobacteraceae bacterium]
MSFSNTSIELGTEYQIQPGKIVFARYAEGYAAGGFNGVPATPENVPPYRPQTVESYEIGAKTEWLDDRLRANINLFISKYDDLQKFVSQTSTTSNVSQLVTKNAAKATVKGVEVEVAARPLPRLDLNLTLGYLDAKYDRFFEDPIGNGVPLDLTDQRFPWTPDWTANFGAEVDVYRGNAGALDFGLNYDYKSKHSVNSLDNPLTRQDGYGLLNASLRFRTPTEKYYFAVYGKNILDEKYFAAAETNSGLATVVLDGMPATWGVSLGARFE